MSKYTVHQRESFFTEFMKNIEEDYENTWILNSQGEIVLVTAFAAKDDFESLMLSCVNAQGESSRAFIDIDDAIDSARMHPNFVKGMFDTPLSNYIAYSGVATQLLSKNVTAVDDEHMQNLFMAKMQGVVTAVPEQEEEETDLLTLMVEKLRKLADKLEEGADADLR